MGPFLCRHYPASSVVRPTPTPRLAVPFLATFGVATSASPEPPPLTRITFPTCRAQYPDGSDQVLVGCSWARSRAGFFPVRTAFPVMQAGRHPCLNFRGLLKLHTRYGLQSCSPPIRRLYREAPP